MTINELRREYSKRTGGKSAPSEHSLQVACVRWFRMAYPRGIIYAVPNGSWCGAVQGRKLKDEGLTAGIPDLVIPMARRGHHALYIEMKNGKAGRLSEHQQEMIARLNREGNACTVCHSFDEFRAIVEDYLSG